MIRLIPGLSDSEREKALDFLDMAARYFNDAEYFRGNGQNALALAAYSYAHAWLDAGVRARWFDAQGNDRLFTLARKSTSGLERLG